MPTGQPTSADTLSFSNGPGVCTVTETTTGGAATVSYSCVGVPGEIEEEPIEPSGGFSAQQVAGEPCATAGPQVAPLQVNILAESQEATVTVAQHVRRSAADPGCRSGRRPHVHRLNRSGPRPEPRIASTR